MPELQNAESDCMKIDIKLAIKLVIFNMLVGCLVFFMIEVLFAQFFIDLVQSNQDSFYIILIFTIGFLISSLVGLVSTRFTAEQIDARSSLISALLSFVINYLMWILIGFFSMYSLVADYSAIEKIAMLPKLLAFFSIMKFSNITLVWLLAQLTFSALFGLFLYFMKAPIRKTKSRSGHAWI